MEEKNASTLLEDYPKLKEHFKRKSLIVDEVFWDDVQSIHDNCKPEEDWRDLLIQKIKNQEKELFSKKKKIELIELVNQSRKDD